jgi:hypothetical protein
VGLPNLRINPLSRVLVVVVVMCLVLLVFACLSLSTSLLGFGLDLRFGGFSVSRKWPNISTLPLGSGVVSYRSYKVHFSTCSSLPVSVGTSETLEVLTQTVETSDSC